MKTACSGFVCFLLLLLFVFLGSKCGKEYSFEGSRQPDSIIVIVPVPAVYALSGAPTDCTNPVIKGTYTVGTNLSSSQNVIVNVDVTTPGYYSITTDTVAGFSFSQAGTFATAGLQAITLQAHGQPTNAGLFTFTPKTAGSQCSFDVPVQNAQPLAVYVLESGSGTGQATCIGSLAGTYKTGQALNASNNISMSVYVANTGNFTVQTKKVNGMVFSYSGNFTATGSQYITLIGSGTPLAAGSFTLTPQIIGPHPLGGEACAVTVKVQ